MTLEQKLDLVMDYIAENDPSVKERKRIGIITALHKSGSDTTHVELDDAIHDTLNELGISFGVRGRAACACAIKRVFDDPSYLHCGITKRLYPDIAKELNSTASRVERVIRYAISVGFSRGDLDAIDRVFGFTVDGDKATATNSEFIAACVEEVRRKING